MPYKIFFSFFIIFCFLTLGKAEAEQGQVKSKQSAKVDPFERDVLRATTKADFEKILLKLSLISPFDSSRGKTIDAAMRIPPSKRFLVFYCVYKSSYGLENNDVYFKIFSELTKEEIVDLFEAVSLFFRNIKDQHACQELYSIFKSVKIANRMKLAKYIKEIIPFDMTDQLTSFIEKITYIEEGDLPDVMARVMTVAKDLNDYGIVDLISYISYIPREKRDFILHEAKKLTSPQMNTISKAHLIDGLTKLNPEDFSNIVELGKQLFFEDTHGGHRSLILKAIQDIKRENRRPFVSQVKPLLKAEDPAGLRMAIIQTLAKFEDSDRPVFISYFPPNVSEDVKNKIFDNLRYLPVNEIKTVLSYMKEQLFEKPANEEKLLITILSSIQMIKINR